MDKQKLQTKVDAMQVELDGMKKLLEKKCEPWTPRTGSNYWVVDEHGDVVIRYARITPKVAAHVGIGNFYQSPELAQAESDRRKLKTRIINTIAELNDGWAPNWNRSTCKWFVDIEVDHEQGDGYESASNYWSTTQVVRDELCLKSKKTAEQLQSQYTAKELTAAYWA